MKSPSDVNMSLDLDLSFNQPSEELLATILEPDVNYLLIQSKVWEEVLMLWIEMIRSDINLKCPDVVRKASSISMGLQFTDDNVIKEMNRTWRQIEKSTDVLSFPIIDEHIVTQKDVCLELGDIVVSVVTAKKQAREMNHDLGMELKWLVSHGLLHLLGWDHPEPKSLDKMLTFQKLLLRNVEHLYISKSKVNKLKNISTNS